MNNHIYDQRDIKLAELVTVVKERAVNSMASPANVVSDAAVELSAAVRAQIVEKTLKRTILRERVRNEATPANPRNCAELVRYTGHLERNNFR